MTLDPTLRDQLAKTIHDAVCPCAHFLDRHPATRKNYLTAADKAAELLRPALLAERDALAAKVERVRALPVGPPSGGYYMVSMRDVRDAIDALDTTPDTGGES